MTSDEVSRLPEHNSMLFISHGSKEIPVCLQWLGKKKLAISVSERTNPVSEAHFEAIQTDELIPLYYESGELCWKTQIGIQLWLKYD